MARESSWEFISFAAVVIIFSVAGEGDNQLTQTSGCVCIGQDVTFTCSIDGGGSTLYNGTTFNCPSANSASNNQILLRHSGFGTLGEPNGMCNNGAITAEGVGVDGTRYTSRLNVTVSSDIVGMNVSCIYDDASSGMEFLIGNVQIDLTSGDELSRPSNISLVGASPNYLTFKWGSVTHSCSTLLYNITMTASNCGTCPPIVSSTTTNCSIEPLQPDEVRVCTFRVQGVLCGNVSGPSNEANFTLQVPDAPTINIIPTYSQQNDSLLRIAISFPEMSLLPFSSSGRSKIHSSPTSYHITYYANNSDYICDSEMIMPAAFCKDGNCSQDFDVTSTSCYPFSQIGVTIFASNVLGNGSVSNRITTGNTNSFVKVTYEEDTTGIKFLCRFLRQQDITELDISCSIEIAQCQRDSISSSALKQLNATTTNVPNVLQIVVTLDNSDEATYCYVVEATNSSYTVHVDGMLNFGVANNSRLSNAAIGGIAVGSILVAFLIAMAVILLVCWKVVSKRKAAQKSKDIGLLELNHYDRVDQHFKLYHVDKNCELGPFMAKFGLRYRIGFVYYEFFRKEEIITEDKDIILMKNDTQEKFSGKGVRELIGAPDATSGYTLKPNIPGCTVFVQSKGVGHRPLTKGTRILYKITEISPSTDNVDLGTGSNDSEELKPVGDDRFVILDVNKPCKLYKFIEKTHGKRYEPGCAFFEFTSATEDIGTEKEVVLMEKSTKKLFTGHKALHMVGAPGARIPKPEMLLQEWRVFVQSKHHGARHLELGTQVLYQEPKSVEECWTRVGGDRFIKLDVNEDSRLETFVESCHLKYQSECFFFEFLPDDIDHETINDNQEVILMNKTSERLFSGPEVKKIIGVSAKTIRRSDLEGYRVFIQNVGAGSRSLESGTYLLYDHAKAKAH